MATPNDVKLPISLMHYYQYFNIYMYDILYFFIKFIMYVFISSWHRCLNSKAVHSGLQVNELVPFLKREAELVRMSVSAKPKHAWTKFVQGRLWGLWTNYIKKTLQLHLYNVHVRSCM